MAKSKATMGGVKSKLFFLFILKMIASSALPELTERRLNRRQDKIAEALIKKMPVQVPPPPIINNFYYPQKHELQHMGHAQAPPPPSPPAPMPLQTPHIPEPAPIYLREPPKYIIQESPTIVRPLSTTYVSSSCTTCWRRLQDGKLRSLRDKAIPGKKTTPTHSNLLLTPTHTNVAPPPKKYTVTAQVEHIPKIRDVTPKRYYHPPSTGPCRGLGCHRRLEEKIQKSLAGFSEARRLSKGQIFKKKTYVSSTFRPVSDSKPHQQTSYPDPKHYQPFDINSYIALNGPSYHNFPHNHHKPYSSFKESPYSRSHSEAYSHEKMKETQLASLHSYHLNKTPLYSRDYLESVKPSYHASHFKPNQDHQLSHVPSHATHSKGFSKCGQFQTGPSDCEIFHNSYPHPKYSPSPSHSKFSAQNHHYHLAAGRSSNFPHTHYSENSGLQPNRFSDSYHSFNSHDSSHHLSHSNQEPFKPSYLSHSHSESIPPGFQSPSFSKFKSVTPSPHPPSLYHSKSVTPHSHIGQLHSHSFLSSPTSFQHEKTQPYLRYHHEQKSKEPFPTNYFQDFLSARESMEFEPKSELIYPPAKSDIVFPPENFSSSPLLTHVSASRKIYVPSSKNYEPANPYIPDQKLTSYNAVLGKSRKASYTPKHVNQASRVQSHSSIRHKPYEHGGGSIKACYGQACTRRLYSEEKRTHLRRMIQRKPSPLSYSIQNYNTYTPLSRVTSIHSNKAEPVSIPHRTVLAPTKAHIPY